VPTQSQVAQTGSTTTSQEVVQVASPTLTSRLLNLKSLRQARQLQEVVQDFKPRGGSRLKSHDDFKPRGGSSAYSISSRSDRLDNYKPTVQVASPTQVAQMTTSSQEVVQVPTQSQVAQTGSTTTSQEVVQVASPTQVAQTTTSSQEVVQVLNLVAQKALQAKSLRQASRGGSSAYSISSRSDRLDNYKPTGGSSRFANSSRTDDDFKPRGGSSAYSISSRSDRLDNYKPRGGSSLLLPTQSQVAQTDDDFKPRGGSSAYSISSRSDRLDNYKPRGGSSAYSISSRSDRLDDYKPRGGSSRFANSSLTDRSDKSAQLKSHRRRLTSQEVVQVPYSISSRTDDDFKPRGGSSAYSISR
jgi:hypothetical protein